MILKASTVTRRGDVKRLAAHLLRTDENEIAQVIDVRGMGGKRGELHSLLGAMFDTRDATGGDLGLFQVSINPDKDRAHRMKGADYDKAFTALESEFGLDRQARILILHHKRERDGDTRPHVHAVYQVADVERRRQADPKRFGYFKLRCVDLARRLERVLGHEILPDRRNPGRYDLPHQQQAKRQGQTVEERRRIVREAWARSDSPQAFRAAMLAQGFDVAQGDRRGAVLVMPDGGPVALARELGMKAAEVQRRFAGHQLEPLAAVAARQQQRHPAREAARPQRRTPEVTKPTPRRRKAAGRDQDSQAQEQPPRREARGQERPPPKPTPRLEPDGPNLVRDNRAMPKELRDALHDLRTRQHDPEAMRRAAIAAHEERFREASFIDGHHPDPSKRVRMPEREAAAAPAQEAQQPAQAAQPSPGAQARENSADLQGQPATAAERAQAAATGFGQNWRDVIDTTNQARLFEQNAADAFAARYGRGDAGDRGQDLDRGHEL